MAIPLEIEYVKGIAIIAITAGAASAMSSHSMSTMFLTNRTATYTRAAPSISLGKLVASGAKNKHAKKHTPITTEVIPVRPPALTPAPDSTYEVTVEVPIKAPATVPTESASIAFSMSCTRPLESILPATLATEVSVPAVSKKVYKE